MRTLVLLLALTGAADLSAQEPRAAVGAQVGYSRSDLSGADADGIRSRQGALTGVFLYFPVGGGVALRPELLFALKGGRTVADVPDGGTATLDFEMAYLELPVLAHWSLPVGRYRPVVFGGLAPALQIGCDVAAIFDTGPVRATCGQAELRFREVDAGLVLGGGVEVHLTRATLALEGRYTGGLRSILDDVRVSNRTFALLLALTF